MKTSNALFTAVGIASVVAGATFFAKGKRAIKEQKLIQQHYQADVAKGLLERVQAMNSYQVIEGEDLEDLLTDLHFFWNGSRALGLMSQILDHRATEFEAENNNLLEDLPGSFAIPVVERHLINAAARLGDFLSELEASQ